jgi:hypothetical protein
VRLIIEGEGVREVERSETHLGVLKRPPANLNKIHSGIHNTSNLGL